MTIQGNKVPKVNPNITKMIDAAVLAAREAEREPSGILSAGRLGHPLQWQMLHYYKIPPKEVDEFTLRKFQRGKDVEDRVVDWLNPTRRQEKVEYRGVRGVMDLYLDMPIEVKSVTNMAFKHIQKEGVKRGHRLQGMLYARALGELKFQVAYVASDDYRVLSFEEEVTGEVDEVIDLYERQKELGTVPVFEALEPWMKIPDYNPYPEWMKLDEEEIAAKLKKLIK